MCYAPGEPSDSIYRQCQLVKSGGISRTTWLPESFAVPGEAVRLKDGRAWTDGWTVAGVFGTATVRELAEGPGDIRAAGEGRPSRRRRPVDDNW